MAQHAVAFDTLAFAKKIESSGMEAKYAESIAEAVRDVFEEDLSETIFTKTDGELLKSELKVEMLELKTELKQEMAELKTELRQEMAELKTELKQEMAELKTELKHEMAELREDVKKDIAGLKEEISGLGKEVKADMLKLLMWMGGSFFAQVALVVSIIKFLH